MPNRFGVHVAEEIVVVAFAVHDVDRTPWLGEGVLSGLAFAGRERLEALGYPGERGRATARRTDARLAERCGGLACGVMIAEREVRDHLEARGEHLGLDGALRMRGLAGGLERGNCVLPSTLDDERRRAMMLGLVLEARRVTVREERRRALEHGQPLLGPTRCIDEESAPRRGGACLEQRRATLVRGADGALQIVARTPFVDADAYRRREERAHDAVQRAPCAPVPRLEWSDEVEPRAGRELARAHARCRHGDPQRDTRGLDSPARLRVGRGVREVEAFERARAA